METLAAESRYLENQAAYAAAIFLVVAPVGLVQAMKIRACLRTESAAGL